MLVEQLKDWIATGLGLALLTKDKAEEMVQNLVREGKLSREEGRELLDHLIQRAQQEKDELQRRADGEIRRLLDAAGLARREDVKRLEAYIEKLEARIERLEASAVDASEPEGGQPHDIL